MPRYEITSPDGKRYEITAPDGATQEQVLAYAQQQFGQDKPDFSNVQGGSDTVSGVEIGGEPLATMPAWKRKAYGAVSGAADAAVGIGQMIGALDEDEARDAMARIDAVRDDSPVAAVAGDVATLAAPAAKIGKLPTLARYAASTGLGGLVAGTRGVRDGEDRMTNAAIGGALGAAGEGVAGGLSRMAQRSAAAVPDVVRTLGRRAQELGIPLTAAQVSDSIPAKVAASAAKYLPFSGAGKAAARQQEAFNQAVGGTFGARAPKLTDEVMQAARQQIGAGYNDVYSRAEIPLAGDALSRLAGARNTAADLLVPDQIGVLDKQLDRIIATAENGTLTGQKYQALRTQLMKAEGQGGVLGNAIKDLRKTLDDIAEGSVGPEDAGKLKSLRSQWANFKVAQKALGQNAGSGGDVRPASLWPLIRNGSTQEMRELARIGQQVLKDPIPDSGTAPRLLALAAGVGGAANPAAIPMLLKAGLAGATLGRAANSNALARLVLRDGRGQTQQALSRYVARPAAIGAAPIVPKPRRKEKDDD